MNIEEEKSAGTILFSLQNSKPLYLTLHYVSGHWDFPKGNIEEGEEEKETVVREVKEETGIDKISFVEKFRKVIGYYYKRNEETLVRKQVIFYLAFTPMREVKLSFEHIGYQWLEYDKALKRLTFKNAKDLLKEAHLHVLNYIKTRTKTLDEFSQQ
ncbi:MAG: NUDIX domain-containing protein [Nitrososphaerales archaeon]